MARNSVLAGAEFWSVDQDGTLVRRTRSVVGVPGVRCHHPVLRSMRFHAGGKRTRGVVAADGQADRVGAAIHELGSGVGGVWGGEPDGGGVAKKNVRSPVGTTAKFGTVTDAVISSASETDGGLGDDETCVCVEVECTVCEYVPDDVAKSSSPE